MEVGQIKDVMQPATGLGMPRRVCVKACQGEVAVVVVKVVRGTVWLSISPPFAWEAILEPENVDEVISVLELARDEARQMAAARGENTPHRGKIVTRAIASNTTHQ